MLWEAECHHKEMESITFCFQNMFYEFLQNSTNRRYVVAVMLLEKLAEEHRVEGKVIKHAKRWDITSKNVTYNAGCIAMKRYLEVIFDRRLREKHFGF